MGGISRGLWVVVLQLLCSWGVTVGFQVYLKELTIYETHEPSIMRTKPDVYMQCDGKGNLKVKLSNVKKKDELYTFGDEEKPVTYVSEGQCRKCRLKESDTLSKDDTFGEVQLCESEFEEDGSAKKSVKGQFDALFECKNCIPPPPPPPPPPPTKEIIYVETTVSEAEKISPDKKVKYRRTHLWNSPLFITLLVGLTLLALVFGGVSYRWYVRVRERIEEERMKEFEAILGDPDVDFEEMVQQDQKAFNVNFWNLIQWRPKQWNRVQTEEDIEKPASRK